MWERYNSLSHSASLVMVALTFGVMMCFERLIMLHINSCLNKELDPTYCHYRSTVDAISLALHFELGHLDNKNTQVRLLFG